MKRLLFATLLIIVSASCSKDDKPPVDFSASKTEVYSGDLVVFTNTSSATGNFTWDFGDGGSSNEQSTTYQFRKAGLRTVTLTLSGGSAVKTRTINVKGITYTVKNTTGFDLENIATAYFDGIETLDFRILGNVSNGNETLGYNSKYNKINMAFMYNGYTFYIVEQFLLTNNLNTVLNITTETQVYKPSRGINWSDGNQKIIKIKDI